MLQYLEPEDRGYCSVILFYNAGSRDAPRYGNDVVVAFVGNKRADTVGEVKMDFTSTFITCSREATYALRFIRL